MCADLHHLFGQFLHSGCHLWSLHEIIDKLHDLCAFLQVSNGPCSSCNTKSYMFINDFNGKMSSHMVAYIFFTNFNVKLHMLLGIAGGLTNTLSQMHRYRVELCSVFVQAPHHLAGANKLSRE